MKTTSFSKPIFLLGAIATGVLGWNSRSVRAVSPETQNRPAPAISGQSWFNTPGNKPITLSDRKGQVTIVQFWTFGCSNCRANLPGYAKWARDFKKQGVSVIGVHTPETQSERDPKNVARQIESLKIGYPVVLDNDGANWNRWGTRYWPTIFVLDRKNRVRAKWEGELDYGGAGGTKQLTKTIQALLAEPA